MKKIITLLAMTFTINVNAQAGYINTLVGSGNSNYSGDGGQATAAGISPGDEAFDGTGNLYIVDVNDAIRKINTLGIISTFAGTAAFGHSGDGGEATAAQIQPSGGIAVDVAGNVYFGESYYIRKVDSLGIISTIAGNGSQGYSGDGGQATLAGLQAVHYMTCDAAGNLYFTDGNSRVRKINKATGIITSYAGGATVGYSGDGGQATAATLWNPFGLTFDAAGNLYIADSYNNRIRKVNTSGIISSAVINLTDPVSIAVDAAGNFYSTISQANINKLIKITNGVQTTLAGNGTAAFSGDGGLAINAELNRPNQVILDAVGNLYICDPNNFRIRKINAGTAAGISQYSNLNTHISIYPNPNNGNFTIETSETEKHNVTLYDVNGKAVLSQTINGKTTIDASSLSEGVYNLSLISNEGVVNKRVVIVR